MSAPILESLGLADQESDERVPDVGQTCGASLLCLAALLAFQYEQRLGGGSSGCVPEGYETQEGDSDTNGHYHDRGRAMK